MVARLGPAGPLALVALILPPLGSIALFASMGVTGPWLRSHGSAGVGVYVGAFALLAGLALLPTYAQCALGGFAFGIAVGVPAAVGGFVGGAIIGYAIAARASGDRVMALLNDRPNWRAVRDALAGPMQSGAPGTGRTFLRTMGMVTLLRLPPNSPFALTNLVLASVKVPLWAFVAGTALGMLPRSAIAVVIGAGVKDLTEDSLKRSAPAWLWGVGLALTIVIVLALGMIANRALARVTGSRAPSPGGSGALDPTPRSGR